jgi:hypothetical protein
MAKSIRYISRAFQGPFGGPLQIRRHVKALVSFMPRKAPYEAGFIQDVFNRRYPELDGVEWIAIDGQPHSEAMRPPWSHSSVLVIGASGGVRPYAYRSDELENAGRWFSWRRRPGVRHFKERILAE